MKKKAILFLGIISGFTLSAQQNLKVSDHSTQDVVHKSRSGYTTIGKSKAAAPIWTEDFADTIGWTIAGHDGSVVTNVPNSLWEHRGTTTIPDNTIGSRGAWSGTMDPIASPTVSNGFVIFDSDFLDNNGVQGAAGTGVAPTPHVSNLTSPMIDLSGYPNVQLTVHSAARYFAGRNLIAFSDDNGVTWKDTIRIHDAVPVNSSTADDEISILNISSSIGNSSQARIRFIFDGSFNEPGANGQGYYYWMLDDLSIDVLPNNAFKFTDAGGAPANDIIFGGDGLNPKTGQMNINQARTVEFDSNILNFGVDPQTNVVLNVEVLQNGAYVTDLTSAPLPILIPGDTGLFSSFFTPALDLTTTGTGVYDFVFSITSDSVPTAGGSVTPYDTAFTVVLDDSTTSLDFGAFDNSLGTPQLGDDGSGLGSLLYFPNASDAINGKVELGFVDIRFSTLTVDGGDIQIEVHDSAKSRLDLVNGFGGSPVISKTFNLTSASGTTARFDVRDDVAGGKSPILLDANNAYYFVVYFFSNGGTNLIRVANDQTVGQGANSIMYNADDARFYTGFTDSRTLSSPWIRAITTDFPNIGLDEYADFKLSIYPNPSNGERVSLSINEGGEYSIELVNTIGQSVYQEDITVNGNETHDMSFEHLSNGVYILNVKGESGFRTSKITIQ